MTPREDKDFVKNLYLVRDSKYFSTKSRRSSSTGLLPEQISRFFLFDGELLNDYETLFSDFDKQAQTVRESIESILGVPALQNTISDLKQKPKGCDQAPEHPRQTRQERAGLQYAGGHTPESDRDRRAGRRAADRSKGMTWPRSNASWTIA